MAMLDEMPAKDSLLKLLLIGDSKAGKTPWAAMASATHNVLYLDGDVGIQSLNAYVPADCKPRIAYLPVGDYTNENGAYVHRFADFFKTFATEGTLTWNDTRGEVFERRSYVVGESTDEVWQIRPAKMDHSSVIIIDSWTALSQSAMEWKAGDLGADLGEVEKVQREIYSGVGNKLTQFLTLIRSMPCHVIVIAHPDEFVKMEKPLGKVGSMKELDMKILWTKMVPKSSSKPHSLTMPKYFSDVGWLDVKANGETMIDFKPSVERIIGGHLQSTSPAKTTTFAELIRAIGGFVPEKGAVPSMSPWLTRYPAGTFIPAGHKPAPVLGATAETAAAALTATLNQATSEVAANAPATTQVKLGGLAALMGKTKGAEPGMK